MAARLVFDGVSQAALTLWLTLACSALVAVPQYAARLVPVRVSYVGSHRKMAIGDRCACVSSAIELLA